MPRKSASMDAKMMKFMSPKGRGRTTHALMDYADPSSGAERGAVARARARLGEIGSHGTVPGAPTATAYGVLTAATLPMATAGLPIPLMAVGAIAGLHSLMSGISHIRNTRLRNQIKQETMAEIDAIRANLGRRMADAGVPELIAPPDRGVYVANPARGIRPARHFVNPADM